MEQKRPIEEFKSTKQLNACAREWRHILGLTDWIIKVDFAHGLDYAGLCDCKYDNQCALILINAAAPLPEGEILLAKQPQELTLVHELLHCFFRPIERTTFELTRLYDLQHQEIERLAKGFIMAKYGLTMEWFKV